MFSVIDNLRENIFNSPYHIFGKYDNCEDYFCEQSNSDISFENLKFFLSC